jgi:hypothetical protein
MRSIVIIIQLPKNIIAKNKLYRWLVLMTELRARQREMLEAALLGMGETPVLQRTILVPTIVPLPLQLQLLLQLQLQPRLPPQPQLYHQIVAVLTGHLKVVMSILVRRMKKGMNVGGDILELVPLQLVLMKLIVEMNVVGLLLPHHHRLLQPVINVVTLMSQQKDLL